MNAVSIVLDAVSPVVLAIPLIILLAVITLLVFGILWLIAYIRKRKSKS